VTSIPHDRVDLPGGGRMPLVGFGTWQLRGAGATQAVAWALDAGYRHVDTAAMYGNEREVGAALAAGPVSRDEVFVTTKCHPRDAGREIDTLRAGLAALGTGRVDLWLVHWPGPPGMWRAFVAAQQAGLARDIGVSNFSLAQVDEVSEATGVVPAVNQVEWSPLLFDRTVLEGHRSRGVALEGYSGLRGGALQHPVVAEIASRHGRTPAQVIVRWHLQHGVGVIPKSSQRERIRSNADVGGFELAEADMAALDALGRS
jgi:diketogulonate reductase-like aldo/keto reductase